VRRHTLRYRALCYKSLLHGQIPSLDDSSGRRAFSPQHLEGRAGASELSEIPARENSRVEIRPTHIFLFDHEDAVCSGLTITPYHQFYNGRQQSRGKCLGNHRSANVSVRISIVKSFCNSPPPGRYNLLDWTTHTPDLEELSLKVYRWSIRLVGVSITNSAPFPDLHERRVDFLR
jgi:hypothetical protein